MKKVLENEALAHVLEKMIKSISKKQAETLIFPEVKKVIQTNVLHYYQLESSSPVIQRLIEILNHTSPTF